ncbi:hypothetical protein AL506_008640 [Streptococcus sp. FDAARGOS_146]|nr:hypothetical protein HMPREF2542_07900 [Streptococcus sp. HMSC034B05]PNM84549.1 hypothetical protein AL506_008640 [Streptococcus sp. FDAARGOS_146]UTX64048.1 hypothetical protein DEH83_01300 [Streptococcus constellatus]
MTIPRQKTSSLDEGRKTAVPPSFNELVILIMYAIFSLSSMVLALTWLAAPPILWAKRSKINSQ